MPTSAIFPIRMNRHRPWTPWKLGALFRSDLWGLVNYCALGLVILWRRHWCLLLSLYGILCTAYSCLFASFLHLLFSLRFSYVCGCSAMTFLLYLRVGHAMLLTRSCMSVTDHVCPLSNHEVLFCYLCWFRPCHQALWGAGVLWCLLWACVYCA